MQTPWLLILTGSFFVNYASELCKCCVMFLLVVKFWCGLVNYMINLNRFKSPYKIIDSKGYMIHPQKDVVHPFLLLWLIDMHKLKLLIRNHNIIHGRWQPRIPCTQEIALFFLRLLKKSLNRNWSVTLLPKKSTSSIVLLSIRFAVLTVLFSSLGITAYIFLNLYYNELIKK